MDIPIAKDFVPLNKITHNIRSGQAVMEYGVGAMVDFVDQTLMTTTPELWDESIVHIHDERLERILGVDFFGMPGGKDEYPKGITYTRFPQWYFCPRCRRFQPLKEWITEYRRKATQKKKEKDPYMKRPRCLDCKTDLVPARIVVACKNGHIDDFPWAEWAHEKNTGGAKPLCNNPILKFETGANTTAGLEGLVIRCDSCKAKATLFGSFDKDAMERMGNNYTCSGFMPWKNQHVSCGCTPQAVQRGASKIYFPKVVSSLVIPPYSDLINTSIENSKRYAECLTIINDYEPEEKESKIRTRLDKWANEIAKQIARDPLAVKRILERKLFNIDGDNDSKLMTSQKYRIEEYEALTGAISADVFDESDFIREEQSANLYHIPGLKRVALVHKVREVRVLTGFSRLNPPDVYIMKDQTDGGNGLISVKEPESNWYPGYEVRGEGIFLEFDDEEINQWSLETSESGNRSAILNEQYSSSYQGQFLTRQISSKFILLHTLSHLLIRQLSFECGYTAASLRERIYCNVPNEDYIMSGILIYTASGDSEGTLGGLVRQGRSDCLPRTFFKALETAKWCSNDPVCIQSHGQGRESLNLAACHACTLLPETSCEEFNVFLDRGLVIGTLKNELGGFFSEWLIKRRSMNEKTGK